jgi:hypothetical protein
MTDPTEEPKERAQSALDTQDLRPGIREGMKMRDSVSIVLTGPDGKVKDERKVDPSQSKVIRRIYRNETGTIKGD